MTNKPLTLEKISKRFSASLPPVVDELDLQVNAGEILTLVGPSGCGKTTTLRLIAGLDRPDSGLIFVAGKEVTANFVPPERRNIGLVFQDYALFPHLNVLNNVLFGLKHLPKPERLNRARETLALVGLTVFESRYPHQLSGGQQQRVSLARSLAPRPALLLLDEPFSSLDAQLRHSTRQEIRSILRKAGTSAILVTHDQEEALTFSDRIAVMRSGKLEQVDTPERIYRQPKTAFVAKFLGGSNLVSGKANGDTVNTLLGNIKIPEHKIGSVMLSIRPEQLSFCQSGIEARVITKEFSGRGTLYTLAIGDQEFMLWQNGSGSFAEGELTKIQVTDSVSVVQ